MPFKELGYRLSLFLKTRPLLFQYLALLREDSKKRVIRRSSSIAIEGPPRCGNHYATYSFIEAQDSRLEIAHHFHAPAQLTLAATWGIPAVAIVRKPDDMAASWMYYMWSKGFTWCSPQMIDHIYSSFFSTIWPVRGSLIIALFDEFTKHGMSSTIERINQKYNANFRSFESLDEERKAAFNAIRLIHLEDPRLMGQPWTNPLPSSSKETAKERFRKIIESAEEQGIFRESWVWYRKFRELAPIY